MEKGTILIYKDRERRGLIKFDKNRYCHVYRRNFKEVINSDIKKGQRVMFELDICKNTSEYMATNIILLK